MAVKRSLLMATCVASFLSFPMLGHAADAGAVAETLPPRCDRFYDPAPTNANTLAYIQEKLRGCVEEPLGPIRAGPDCNIAAGVLENPLQPFRVDTSLPMPLLQGTSAWTVGAIVETPCLEVPSPMVPFHWDIGTTTPPFTVDFDGTVACKKRHIPFWPDEWYYDFTVTANIHDARYTGQGPWGLTGSEVNFFIPEDSESWRYRHEGRSKTVCKGNQASDFGVAGARANGWVTERVAGLELVPADVTFYYLRDATGSPIYEIPAEGTGLIKYDPLLNSGVWEWHVDAEVVSSPNLDVVFHGEGRSFVFSPGPVGEILGSVLNDDPSEVS